MKKKSINSIEKNFKEHASKTGRLNAFFLFFFDLNAVGTLPKTSLKAILSHWLAHTRLYQIWAPFHTKKARKTFKNLYLSIDFSDRFGESEKNRYFELFCQFLNNLFNN